MEHRIAITNTGRMPVRIEGGGFEGELRPGRRAEIEPRRGQTVKLVALDVEWPPDQQADLPTPATPERRAARRTRRRPRRRRRRPE